ncbi:hypothetical protein DERF_007827 [Dermatophagoides farinae]|uniref:Uncharacterized protein n=1 Tax=Dermatophagoides farinae TaxID=6954 RepID=A0A922HZ01_DERFA|nr:hypothetical protein DERF_007827 [Dermatophagoides farinae]
MIIFKIDKKNNRNILMVILQCIDTNFLTSSQDLVTLIKFNRKICQIQDVCVLVSDSLSCLGHIQND